MRVHVHVRVPIGTSSAQPSESQSADSARAYYNEMAMAPAGADSSAPAVNPGGLVVWSEAQRPYLGASRRLAGLIQAQLAPGSVFKIIMSVAGLQENVAGLLCYLLGWLTGIIFLLIDKRPFVRFHAAQSIVIFGFLFVIRLILIFAVSGSMFGFWAFYGLISLVISLITLAAWVILMIQAYQGKMFEVPGAAGIAKNIAGKVQ